MANHILFLAICLLMSAVTGHLTHNWSRLGKIRHNTRIDRSLKRLLSLRGGSSVKHPSSVSAFDSDMGGAEGRLVVVDFSATWCMPCKMIAPVFEEMSDEFTNAIFVKVDVDEVPEIAQRYQVLAMPTFLFLRDGKIVGRFSGASAEKLREMLTSLL